VEVRRVEEFDAAFKSLSAIRAEAVDILSSPLLRLIAPKIAA
jgi:hypothetical protein